MIGYSCIAKKPNLPMYEHPKDVWAPKYNFNVKKLMIYYYVNLIILLHLMSTPN